MVKYVSRRFLVLSLVLMAVMALSAMAFEFNGTIYDSTGTTPLNHTYIEVTVYNMSDNFAEVNFYTTYSNASGWFNLTIAEESNELMYSVEEVSYDNGGQIYTSKPVPSLPYQEFITLGTVNFYLKPGFILNITVYNGTDYLPFNYQVKDEKLGYPVSEEYSQFITSSIVYLQTGRNYSVLVYPNQTMPRSLNVTDPSADSQIDLMFNATEGLAWVSGYVETDDLANFTSFHIIPFVLESGARIYPDYSVMPLNMSTWRGGGTSDLFNSSSGFYNMTLPAVPDPGIDILLLYVAFNQSGDGEYYGAYQNLSLTIGDPDILNLNASLVSFAGSILGGINQSSGEDSLYTPFTLVNFSLRNESGNQITQSTFVDATFPLGDIDLKLSKDVGASDSGVFDLPLLSDQNVTLQVFAPSFAPRKQKVLNSDLDNNPVIINLSTFSPSSIEDGEFGDGDVFIDLIKSTLECNVPNYNVSACSLSGGRVNFTSFNPLSVLIGGGEVSFVMGKVSNNITIIYKNADLLASGPPDVLFDGSGDESQQNSTLEEAWRFGSQGPEIYDEVLIGIPLDSTIDPNTADAFIDELYDENWNVVWNSSQGVGALPEDYVDFNTADPLYFNSTDGMGCNSTDSNLSSSSCYLDTARRMIWMIIPHFSGVGPVIMGEAIVTGDALYNLSFTNTTALTRTVAGSTNATYNITVTNTGNSTVNYNFTSSSDADSVWINGSTTFNVSIVNGSSVGLVIRVQDSSSGTYQTEILAVVVSNTSISFNSTRYGLGAPLTTVVDATAPTITLNTQNNSWTNNNQSSLNFTFVDALSATATCDLYVDGTLVNESLSASNNTATLITPNVTLAEGARTWYVNCTDLYDNEGTSTPRILNIDKTAPVVNLITPNATWSTSATPSFTFNYTDASTASCTLYVGGIAKGTNSSVTNNTNTAITANASLSQGSNTWYVNCTDQASNVGTPGYNMTTLVDSIYPTSLVNNINGVSSGYGTNNATLTINFTANDTNIINWTLAVYNSSWGLLQNWTEITNNISAVRGYTATANGTYYVNLTVRDNATNVNTTSFTVYVDQSEPVINSLSVGSITSSGGTLTVNATDAYSAINNCTYSGAGSGSLTLSGGLYTAALSGLSASTAYTVNVTCFDLTGYSVSNTTSFTTSASSSSSSSSSSGGAAGASGGVSSGAVGQFEQKTWTSINAGETATINVPNGEIGVTEVSFELGKTMYGVWLKVAKLDNLPKDVAKFDKKTYKYVEITKSIAFKEGDFKNAQVEFKVAKSWLTQNKLTAENLALYRYADSKWNALTTTVGKDDGTYIHYSADTPGFSYFLIGEKAAIAPTLATPPKETAVPQPSLTEEAPAVTEKPSNWSWIAGGTLIVGLFIWILVMWKKNRSRVSPRRKK